MLKKHLQNHNVILASGSPRRQQFLRDLGIDFSIALKEVEEIYPNELKAEEITDYLSLLKSKAFTSLKENDILITSDTIVWHNNEALGKPKDRKDAFQMLSKLSNNKHEVITSICIKTSNNVKVIHDKTVVFFKELSTEEINFYIENFKPFDKAGSYGIQDWIGFIGVEKIEGSYFNVVGLPIHKLYTELLKF